MTETAIPFGIRRLSGKPRPIRRSERLPATVADPEIIARRERNREAFLRQAGAWGQKEDPAHGD